MKLSAVVLAVAGLLLMNIGTQAFAEQAPAKHDAQMPAAASAAGAPIAGKVVDTADAGGYTYVQLENKGEKIWVAVPKMKVKKGEQVAFAPGNTMYGFTSKTLKRKFDKIIFSPGPVVLPGTKKDVQAQEKEAKSKLEKVSKAKGAGAQTVAECYANTAKLDNKTVVVRGKVVKVSKMIMGKNWVHLQDGTGDPSKGTHDLVVTTMDLPKVDEVVTATGTIVKDKDFGYGYKYDVMMEDAKISK
jgi:hypothetical protein